MLKRIQFIKRCGVYRDFEWPDGTPDFSRRNLLYGWNYSGKTTLSRVFRFLETGDLGGLPAESEFSLLLVDDSPVGRGGSRANTNCRMRVFNADFVEENLLWGSGAQPLLVLGAESVSLQSTLDELTASSEKAKRWVGRLAERKRKAELKRDEGLSSIAAKVKLRAKLPVFNRAPHLSGVLSSCAPDYAKAILSPAELAREASVLGAEPKRHLNEIALPRFSIGSAPYSLFERVASRSALVSLSSNPGLERWALDGYRLHSEGDDCAFCGNKLDSTRWAALSAHFSTAVKSLLVDVDQALKDCSEFRPVVVPSAAELYEDLRPGFSEIHRRITLLESRIAVRLGQLSACLEDKKVRVEESYKVPRRPIDRLSALRCSLVVELNKIIAEHNHRVAAGGAARDGAREKIVRHYSCEYYSNGGFDKAEKEISFLAGWLGRAEGIERGLSNRIKQTQLAIEKLSIGSEKVNHYSRLYFGSDRLIVRSDSGRYRVFRDGLHATTLSEGEKTAISFAYFMASLEQDGQRLQDTVVYIDDPVSSLDANHTFNTFAIIKAKLADCAQLFISTHHYEFFRLLKDDSFFREWDGRNGRVRRASCYRVLRIDDRSQIIDLPEVLRRFKSEYQLLVAAVYEFDAKAGLSAHMVPNLLRRVLEAYTSFRFPASSETLDGRILRIFPNAVVANRVYKLINHLSHSGSPDVLREMPSDEEVREVTKVVLRGLEAFDAEHFHGLRVFADSAE